MQEESPAQRLERFRKQTSSWDYRGLGEDQHGWLEQYVELQHLTPASRRSIILRSTSAAQLLNRTTQDDDEEDDTGIKDVWALKTAIRLTEPLRHVHDTLFQDWECNCHSNCKHSHVLVAFAAPCQYFDKNTNCVLRFTASHEKQLPWRTVFLSITEDLSAQPGPEPSKHGVGCSGTQLSSSPDAASENPIRLHDHLIQTQYHCSTTAKLDFFSHDRSWTIAPELTGGDQGYSMVALSTLIADEATHSIRKEPYERRVSLALIVTYAFLQLGNSAWFPYALNNINIWFFQAKGAAPVLLQPYLEIDLDVDDDMLASQSSNGILRMINPDMPCLPVLGKLILELISGSSVALENIERFMVGYRHQNPERAPYVWGAVRSCFFDVAFKGETIHGNEALRIKFLEQVIYRLHKLLSQCNKSLEGEILKASSPPVMHPTASRKRRHHSVTSPGIHKRPSLSPAGVSKGTTAATDGPELTPCLHDDGSQRPFDQIQ
jgi:hypothetical protein